MAWSKPKLFYAHSISSISASTTASGFLASNLLDMKEGTKWKANDATGQTLTVADPGGPVKVNYLAIAGHNLKTAGSLIDLQYSTDNFASDINSAFTPFTPANDKVFVKEFTEQDKRYWRLKITSNAVAPFMAIAIWGEVAILDYASVGFDPDGQREISNITITDKGYLAGIHKRYIERRVRVRINDASLACYDILSQWWENSGTNNFFFGWNTGLKPSEVYLMRPSKNFTNTFTRQGQFRNISIDLIGRKED